MEHALGNTNQMAAYQIPNMIFKEKKKILKPALRLQVYKIKAPHEYALETWLTNSNLLHP